VRADSAVFVRRMLSRSVWRSEDVRCGVFDDESARCALPGGLRMSEAGPQYTPPKANRDAPAGGSLTDCGVSVPHSKWGH
jgi:hypothetical protein